jgi:hypothetical protein
MDRMYRVLAFWTLIIAIMAFLGHMAAFGVIFLVQTLVFLLLGYMNLSEKTYIYIFWAYMIVSFSGIFYWAFFQMA